MSVFARSAKDFFLVLLVPVQLLLVVFGVAAFQELSLGALFGLGALLVFLICTNFQCTGHYFIHNPFFTSEALNRIFSVLNSLALGMPQSLYRVHHLHHHKYNNDAKDPETGTTQDLTSTYRFSKNDQEENVFSYAILGFFRNGPEVWMDGVRKNGAMGILKVETAAILGFVVSLFLLNWLGALLFYLPVWYLGQVIALAENYLEHHGATPGNRLTDSVSCYNPLYNFIWFNNGYHQEHHFRPQVHWTELPAMKRSMLPESERRVVRGAHWFNFNPPVTSRGSAEPEASTESTTNGPSIQQSSRTAMQKTQYGDKTNDIWPAP